MAIPALLLTEMQGLNRVHATVELTLGGTVYRYSAQTAVASESVGLHLPYIESMSGFGREANFSEFSLGLPSPSVEIFDPDRTIQKLLGGPLRGRIDGSPVACWRRSAHVVASSHWKFFEGIVANHGLARDRVFRFNLAPDTRVLKGNPKIPYLTKAEYPTAPADFLGTPHKLVFGTHLSTGITNAKGMIQCIPAEVDANGDCSRWIVSYGQATGIVRLFRGTSQSAAVEDTANWAFTPWERGGHRYQMAFYNGGAPKPKPTDYIAVDMHGLSQVGPVATSQPAITNPAECIRTFLAHFAYGAGDTTLRTTAWETETGKPIATELFDAAESYFSARGDKCAMVVRANETVLDVFNAWCDDFNAGALWDDAWRVGAIPEDESELGIYTDGLHVRQDLGHALDDLQGDNTRSSPVSEVEVKYLRVDSAGNLTASATVSDPAAEEIIRDTYELDYGRAEAI